jgi:hypothetical protein
LTVQERRTNRESYSELSEEFQIPHVVGKIIHTLENLTKRIEEGELH